MPEFEVGGRVRIVDRPGWSGGYRIAGWEGTIVEVKQDTQGYAITLADKTGYRMAFPEADLEKI